MAALSDFPVGTDVEFTTPGAFPRDIRAVVTGTEGKYLVTTDHSGHKRKVLPAATRRA